MTIAIMQPYFFPYLGQFQLINAVERFVLCDDVQYIRHGWINRNRILKPGEGFYYITVPIAKHESRTLIKDIRTVEGYDWKDKILKQTEHYKKRSLHYSRVNELLKECFSYNETNITKLNALCLKAACDYIGIDFKVEITSEMGFDYSGITCTDDWAITISKQLNATTYLNPPGGAELYDKGKFLENDIQLSFVKPQLKEYDQQRSSFEPGLSIIDIMMFNSPTEIKGMLNDYQLL
jgi:hypothetical protein